LWTVPLKHPVESTATKELLLYNTSRREVSTTAAAPKTTEQN